jgi:hypothetical protein
MAQQGNQFNAGSQNTAALQLLLPQQTADLCKVYRAALGAGDGHKRQAVPGKRFHLV